MRIIWNENNNTCRCYYYNWIIEDVYKNRGRELVKKYNYVYKIANTINNKIYIGKHSTDDLDDGYMGSGVVLRQAYKKYGLEYFNKEVIDYYTSEEELNQGEIYWIAQFNSTNPEIGYNLTYGGDGVIPTEETKQKISEALKGKPLSEETKQKMKGRAVWNKGKPMSEEQKQKMSKALKGKPNGRLGKPLSEETKRKIGESHKGKPLSEETKQKIRLAWQRRKEKQLTNENHTKKY